MSEILQSSPAVVKPTTPLIPEEKDACSSEAAATGADVTSPGNPPLPKGCRPLTHQVAGHRYGKGRLGIGMLQHSDGSIMKPLQPPPRGAKEQSFYERAFNEDSKDPLLITLRPFLPRLLGVWNPAPSMIGGADAESSSPSYSYLKLEDVCRRFRNPSILDIKIGRVSYDPEAGPHKRKIETAKYPPLQQVGFQLLGMRIAGMSANEAIFYDKHYGRSLRQEDIVDGLNLYLSGNKAWKKYIVKAFIHRLQLILNWFESQYRFQFYASSLLLIYEGEFLDGSSDSDDQQTNTSSSLRHQLMTRQPVDSYLSTVKNLLKTKPADNNNNNAAANSTGANLNGATDTVGGDCAAVGAKTSPSAAQATGAEGVRPHSAGAESGYSSEAESKMKANEALQRQFVASLSRRIEESTARCGANKYRYPPHIVDVRMIDFAHVYEESGKTDENYMYGLRNLIRHFESILKQL